MIFFLQSMFFMQTYTRPVTGAFFSWWYNKQLSKAIKSQDLSKIKALILKGADVNLSYKEWISGYIDNPLTVAIRMQNTDMVKFLLCHGADVAAKWGILKKDMLCCAIEGYLINPKIYQKIIKLLLDHGADVDKLNYYEMTPIVQFLGLFFFHANINQNDIDVLKLMLQHSAHVAVKDAQRNRALLSFEDYWLSQSEKLTINQKKYMEEAIKILKAYALVGQVF